MAAFFGQHGQQRSYAEEEDKLAKKMAQSSSSAAPKRISTPAGMRLSVIMENTVEQKSRPRKGSRTGGTWSKGSTLVNYPMTKEEHVTPGYSYSIFSEKNNPPKLGLDRIRASNFLTRKGGWKRLVIFAAILLAIIVAVVVAVTVTQLHKNDKSSSSQNQGASSNASPSSSAVGVVGVGGASPTSVIGSSPTSTDVPSNFPIGAYSFTTFLNTVGTECTSNPNTWSCFPYTIYSEGATESIATFNWVISQAAKVGTYQISSVSNPFAINFENVAMKMVDAGTDNENYQFQFEMDKQVVPTAAITNDNSATTCFFNSTTFTGYLYTRKTKNYASASVALANSTYAAWPFAARAEQAAAGGDNVPNCYQTTDGNIGAQVGNFTSMDASTLCDCLYSNYFATS